MKCHFDHNYRDSSMSKQFGPTPRYVRGDDKHTPTVKRHSLRKIEYHNQYASLFANAMKRQWPQLAYFGLCCGSGLARIDGTDEIVETSALSALRMPFTHYIFVDSNPDCISALRERCVDREGKEIVFINGDVNQSGTQIVESLPKFSAGKGLLSFCFLDPFDLGIKMSLMRELSRRKMDIMVLLMTGADFRRNVRTYTTNLDNRKIDELLGDSEWRTNCTRPIRDLVEMYDNAMVKLGYLSARDSIVPVHAHNTGVHLYSLALYTQNERGKDFWLKAKRQVTGQSGLFDNV